MLRMPIAARRRHPSLRYSDRGSFWVRCDGCSRSAGRSSRLPRSAGQRRVSIAGLRRQSFALISRLLDIVNMTIRVFATSTFEPDESTHGSLPLLAACRTGVYRMVARIFCHAASNGEIDRIGAAAGTGHHQQTGYVDSIDGSTPLPGAEDEDPLYIPGHGHQAPLAANLVEPAQQELSKAQDRLDDAEYRIRGVFAPSVEFLAFGRRQAM